MKLQEIMTTNVHTVGPETELIEAVTIMKLERVGMLPVIAMNRIPIGVITDRDIAIRAFLYGIEESAPVRNAMSHKVFSIHQGRNIEAALAFMATNKVSRLLVCDDSGHLTGVVTLKDIAVHCKDDALIGKINRCLALSTHQSCTNSSSVSVL